MALTVTDNTHYTQLANIVRRLRNDTERRYKPDEIVAEMQHMEMGIRVACGNKKAISAGHTLPAVTVLVRQRIEV